MLRLEATLQLQQPPAAASQEAGTQAADEQHSATACLAALAVQRLPLGSPELTLGLAVFCCMPTTLSSGVSLTQVTSAHLCWPHHA